MTIHLISVHTDKAVWGEDVSVAFIPCSFDVWDDPLFDQADEFKPERMLDGKFEALPVRVCIYTIHTKS